MINPNIKDNTRIINYLEKLGFEYMKFTKDNVKAYVYESDTNTVEIELGKDSNGDDAISVFYTQIETKEAYIGSTYEEVISCLNSLFKHKLRKIAIQKLLN
jgi:hypothetical protein